ncbi:MAG: GWxTD domain-containing protein [Gemmatimonadales bacterium]
MIPRLFDPALIYREMGLLTAREPVPFVGAVHWLAGPSSDSTLGVVGLSLSSDALTFRRQGTLFEARYRVDGVFRQNSSVVREFSSEETVRVVTFDETKRTDESLIFQRFVSLPAGTLTVSVSVRDVYSAGVSTAQGTLVVPSYGADRRLSSLVPVHEAVSRATRAAIPEFVLNPRATAPYGSDTVSLYFEVYRLAEKASLYLRAVERSDETEVWRDSVVLLPAPELAAQVVRVPTSSLSVGEIRFDAVLDSSADTVHVAALVSFSDEWAISNFEQTLSLLRYFGPDSTRRRLLDAPVEARREQWKEFWRETDPDPDTPENEALNRYFARLMEANERFGEATEAGWLTDRGEVFITLGEPDQVLESGSEFEIRGSRVIRWSYQAYRLTIDFVDETGFGRFRLTPASRAEFLSVKDRLGTSG